MWSAAINICGLQYISGVYANGPRTLHYCLHRQSLTISVHSPFCTGPFAVGSPPGHGSHLSQGAPAATVSHMVAAEYCSRRSRLRSQAICARALHAFHERRVHTADIIIPIWSFWVRSLHRVERSGRLPNEMGEERLCRGGVGAFVF